LFAGCDRVDNRTVNWLDDAVEWVRDPFYRGTNIGYLRCVKDNENNPEVGLTKDLVLSRCSAKHALEKEIPVDARGAYLASGPDDSKVPPPKGWVPITKPFFAVWITNKSSNKIVTTVVLRVTHADDLDASGKQIPEILKAENLWVEPSKEDFVPITNLKFFPNPDRLKHFSWSILSVRGLRIKVQ
jgi:hypothetical protein